MESFGECRGCRRNIKFAVKQARLCRTCYNKTYLTSQKRREYYKNKKKRREMPATTSSPTRKDDRGHRHPHHPPHNGDAQQLFQDPVAAAQLYQLIDLQSCSDCVPRLFVSNQSPALSLAALAQASLQHQQHLSSSPSSPTGGSSSHHLSSATTSSLPSSPSPSSSPSPYQQLHLHFQHNQHQQQLAHSGPASPPPASSSPPTASSAPSSATASPYGSPPTATALLHDLLQQVSAFPAFYAALGLAATAPLPVTVPEAVSRSITGQDVSSLLGGTLPNSFVSPGLPSLSSFISARGSTNPLAIPTPRYPPSPSPHLPVRAEATAKSHERPCEHCNSPAQRVGHSDTWLCTACATRQILVAQPATRSPAIKNLLN